MMLLLQHLTYIHPNKDLLFEELDITAYKQDKIALIGNNGSGKSTLLKIIAGILPPSGGKLKTEAIPYYIPQGFGQYDELTVAAALGISDKLHALKDILAGSIDETDYAVLDDDWAIEERCMDALRHWQLEELNMEQPMRTLSGGQKTKVFLAGIVIHNPAFILMDEPGNHLDKAGLELLYDFIRHTTSTLIIVSHDRSLLNLLPKVWELDRGNLRVYGGNYAFYKEQKQLEQESLAHDLKAKEKALRKAKEKERETAARQQKLDARGKRKQQKAGIPTIVMNTLRSNAEQSTAKMKDVHADKTEGLLQEWKELRKELPAADKMRLGFENSDLHKGKILFSGKNMYFSYGRRELWSAGIDVEIMSGERITLKGSNGSGKTTLLRIILGTLEPRQGTVYRPACKCVYIDQDYSLIDNRLNVYEQAQQFNTAGLQEHEVKNRLNRFLFTRAQWHQYCNTLSGGERMRLMLCCLTLDAHTPDLIVLDEPTNNLDIQNIEILTAAINDYRGTLLVVSHDAYFLKEIGAKKEIRLC